MSRIGCALIAILASRIAIAEPLAVQVIDVAGEQVYVEPGEDAGLRVGTRVTIDGRGFIVGELNAKTAMLVRERGTPSTPVPLGATGTAEVVAARAPRPQEAFREQWPAAIPPARLEKVQAIELAAERGGTRITVIGHAFGAHGQGETRGSAEARVIASFERIADQPLGADLDVAGRASSLGPNRAERVPIFVRAAQLRWGSRHQPSLAAGRLRYAATAVGMLDGARAAARIGTFELAAFGGLVPDPLSGEPDTGAARFGAELGWNAPAHAWQPRLALSAHGSTWEGELDERRLSVAGSAAHRRAWFDAWAEAQSFASDNPFGANAFELTGAGASAAWRSPRAHAGLGVTFLRPERSLRLAAALPADWLCLRDAAEACAGGDRSISATASSGLRGPRWAIDAIVSIAHTTGIAADRQLDRTAYVRGELRSARWRAFVAPAAGATTFSDWQSIDLGAGLAAHSFDASLAYRPELLDERGADGRVTLHSLVADVRGAVGPTVELAVTALATFADGRDVLAALTTIVWRAR